MEGDVEAFAADSDIEVIRSADGIFGAQGDGTGTYVRDPDGNLVELKTYPQR